jgi:phosphoribosylformylglycinamidine synthase
MWTFAETVRGLADICLEMGLPVTGGNVSFYNQTGKVAILPTPVIGVLGVIQDVRTRTSMATTESGLELFQLGNTDDNFSGSEWAHLHGQMGDRAPTPDIDHETRLVKVLLAGQSYFEAAHDISNGGFAATISEMVLKSGIGATIELPAQYIPGGVTAGLFAETPGRVVIAVKPENVAALQKIADEACIPMHKVGTTGGDALTINGAAIPLSELRTAFTETFPKLFG